MKIILVEDEEAAVRRLSKMINKLRPSAEIVDVLDSVEDTINWFIQYPSPDLLILDVHLSDGISFEIFNHIQIDCPIVFTTAYDQYAVKAFSIHAVDYLLKPIKIKELDRALHRSSARLNQNQLQALQKTYPQQSLPKRVLVRIGKTIKVIAYDQAAYFYTKDKITFLYTFDGHRYPIDSSLERLEELIDPRQFFRINRQFIVNLKAISEMHSYSKSRVKIDLKPHAPLSTIVSSERSARFKKWLIGE